MMVGPLLDVCISYLISLLFLTTVLTPCCRGKKKGIKAKPAPIAPLSAPTSGQTGSNQKSLIDGQKKLEVDITQEDTEKTQENSDKINEVRK